MKHILPFLTALLLAPLAVLPAKSLEGVSETGQPLANARGVSGQPLAPARQSNFLLSVRAKLGTTTEYKTHPVGCLFS